MADTTTPSSAGDLDRTAEEAGFYHEAALNATWTGSRLAVGGLTFLFGSFVFAYFYLRSLNNSGRWIVAKYPPPSAVMGAVIMLLVLASAAVHYLGLQRIKAGNKRMWQIQGLVALGLGLVAVVLQILELLYLPFWPGSSGFASVFTAFYPVFVVVLLAGLIWLEIMLMRSRSIPAISFVELPPTYPEAFEVQRFQANLSAFTLTWKYLAVMAVLYSFLFYVI
jgi:heme/copper-type cytochrome/quinol oxidase subunit 3